MYSSTRRSDDIRRRHPSRRLRDPFASRRGRHGRGLPGEGFPARPRRRHQGPPGNGGEGRRTSRPLRAGGPCARRAQPPRHRHDLCGRGIREHALSRDGARGGRKPRHGDPFGRPSPRRVLRDRDAARRSAVRGARARHRAPRPEARQRHGHPRGSRQGARLRPGPGRRARLRSEPHEHADGEPHQPDGRGPGLRHRRLHVSGADARRQGGRAVRRLLARRRALPDVDRRAPVSGGERRGPDLLDPARPASSVTDLRADVPPHLSRILRRCLEKDPATATRPPATCTTS